MATKRTTKKIRKPKITVRFNETEKLGMTEARKKEISVQWNSRMKSNEYKMRKITWGKHLGQYIQDLPMEYLKWLVLNTEWNTQWRDWFTQELRNRIER
jgi:kynurenine formamidase